MAGGYVNKVVVLIQGLVLIPLYLYFIGDRMYGLWLASGGVLTWLAFMDMGIGNLLIQRVSSSYGRQDYKLTADYFMNGILVYAVLAVVFYILVFVLSFFIADWFGAKGEDASLLRLCFQLAGIAAGGEFLNNCLRGFSQALLRPLFPMICMVGFRILGLLVIVFLLYQNYGLLAIPMGLLFMAIPVLILNGYYSVRLIRELSINWNISKNIILDFFRLGPYLLISRIGNSMVRNIEPILIAIILRPEWVPVFVITRRAADMLVQFLRVIDASTFPSFAHLYAEGNFKSSQYAVSKIMTLIFSAGLIGFGTYVAGNRSFVYLWVGPEKFLGQGATLLMGLALLMMFIKELLSRFIIGMGDIIYPSVLTFAEAVSRVFLMVTLLYGIGLIGLPLGMLISCLIFMWFFYKRLNKKLPMTFLKEWHWVRLFMLLIVIFWIGFLVAQKVQVFETWFQWGRYVFLFANLLLIFNLLLNPALRSLFVDSFIPLFKKPIVKKAHVNFVPKNLYDL